MRDTRSKSQLLAVGLGRSLAAKSSSRAALKIALEVAAADGAHNVGKTKPRERTRAAV